MELYEKTINLFLDDFDEEIGEYKADYYENKYCNIKNFAEEIVQDETGILLPDGCKVEYELEILTVHCYEDEDGNLYARNDYDYMEV